MPVEIKVPGLGESITEVLIAEWVVKEGDRLEQDQTIVSLDSEKTVVDLPAPAAGTLVKILKSNGETAVIGEVIGLIEPSAVKPSQMKKEEQASPSTPPPKTVFPKSAPEKEVEAPVTTPVSEPVPPSQPESATAPPEPSPGNRQDEILPMTSLRRTVAKRLVEAQHTMAIVTTFNEIDMSAIIALRKQYQDAFQEKYGVKLGFMSFFVKAVVEALREVPELNAEVRGNEIVYHRYFDIGVAIGAGRGLVVPPLRDVERMSFAEIEKTIADLATRAKENKLKPDELQGGTFTISNGGVYGSLLSTPIINPPQSGILGLHTIQERPIGHDEQIVLRPMMYAALSYDHRIVDGREAVTFLRRVKEICENPLRLLLEV